MQKSNFSSFINVAISVLICYKLSEHSRLAPTVEIAKSQGFTASKTFYQH